MSGLLDVLKRYGHPGPEAPPLPTEPPNTKKSKEINAWLDTKIKYEKYLSDLRAFELAQFCLAFLRGADDIIDYDRDRVLFTLCLLVLNPAPQDVISQMTGAAAMKLPKL